MTTAVIGATGRVGSEIVRGVLARGEAVTALVRDPGKARRAFGEPGGLHIRSTRLDDPRDLTEALDGIRTVFIAMGSIGIEGVLQRIAINAAAGIRWIEQVTRLSVLNTSADSLGINQRAHYSIDQFASSTAVPYSTIRPAIFSASLLAATREVHASRTWTGLGKRATRLGRLTTAQSLPSVDVQPTVTVVRIKGWIRHFEQLRIPSTDVVHDVGHSLLDRQVGLGVVLDPLGVVQDVPVGRLQIIGFVDHDSVAAVRGYVVRFYGARHTLFGEDAHQLFALVLAELLDPVRRDEDHGYPPHFVGLRTRRYGNPHTCAGDQR